MTQKDQNVHPGESDPYEYFMNFRFLGLFGIIGSFFSLIFIGHKRKSIPHYSERALISDMSQFWNFI